MKAKFQKAPFRTGSTYVCGACQKRTRDTGRGEGDVQLCARCYTECCLDNAISDHGEDSLEAQSERDRLAELNAQQRRG
mgnify:CR=1 FL=1